jgi:hypothetical protein
MEKELSKKIRAKLIMRKCHVCSHINESAAELEKCTSCAKSFMPLNYFDKIHNHDEGRFEELFAHGHEITDEDIIKGLFVLW